MEQQHYLCEDVIELVCKTLAAEDVYSPKVGHLHATEPHVGYVLHKKFLHLTTRVHVVEICVNDDLKKHPGIVTAGSATGITGYDFTDVETVYYRTDDSRRMILWKIIAKTWRKQQIIVGIVGFKDYLCHCLIELFIFNLQLQDSNFLSQKQ